MGDASAAEFLESREVYATPVLSVDGTLVVGFQKARIDALLGIGG
jgi:hypothetical protein